MDISFQLATLAELDEIVSFSRRLNEDDPSFTGDFHFDEMAVRAAAAHLLSDPGLGRVWIVRRGDIPAGYIVVTFGFSLESHGRDALVDEVYLLPEHRAHGVGRQVMAFVEAEMRRLGMKSIYLEVERTNSRAQQLYRDLGYEDHERYLMSKRLDGQIGASKERFGESGSS